MLLQIPGGPELLIILLVMALVVGVPVVLAGVFLFTRVIGGDGDDSDEVAELKARVDELEAQIAAGSEAAANDVSVEDDRGEAGERRERTERQETAAEASGEERPASSADEDDADGGNGR